MVLSKQVTLRPLNNDSQHIRHSSAGRTLLIVLASQDTNVSSVIVTGHVSSLMVALSGTDLPAI